MREEFHLHYIYIYVYIYLYMHVDRQKDVHDGFNFYLKVWFWCLKQSSSPHRPVCDGPVYWKLWNFIGHYHGTFCPLFSQRLNYLIISGKQRCRPTAGWLQLFSGMAPGFHCCGSVKTRLNALKWFLQQALSCHYKYGANYAFLLM